MNMKATKEAMSMDDTASSKHPKLTVNLSGKKYHLSIESAFSLAHQLVCRGHLKSATSVLEWLEEVLPSDRRVKVLHARCEARQGHYAKCSQLLNEVFLDADQLGDVPGKLHDAIVYRTVGLLPYARNELKELCAKHPELPSLWLFAGDLWLAVGRPDKAEQAWNAAKRHDDQEPKLVATAANHRIQELAVKE